MRNSCVLTVYSFIVVEKVIALPEIHMVDQKCKGFHYPLVTKAMKSGSLCLRQKTADGRTFPLPPLMLSSLITLVHVFPAHLLSMFFFLALDPSGSRIRDFSSSELSMLKRVEGKGKNKFQINLSDVRRKISVMFLSES